MSDIIHLLPEHVANQIAAGEVVQRPASVVKELLENAIDAGATTIRLLVKDAGKTLIQVIDNGRGMSETDARMSFERHATSKITRTEDLFRIVTMGFRGEALASIAAVAQVEMMTRLPEREVGTRLEVEGSKLRGIEPHACPAGTSVSVRNIFFNVPARRYFLKSDAIELRHMIDEFERVVLTHPEIEFSMSHNGTEVLNLPKSNLRQRIVHTFGNKYNEKLVPVEESTDIVTVTGFAGKPDASRKTRGEQFFFANGRYIRNAYLHHAVMNAYDQLLPPGHYPLYFLYLQLDPAFIDINIHPTKTEIKFQDERAIYAILNASVKRALGKFSISPSLDFDQEISIRVSPISSAGPVVPPQIRVNPAYNPFNEQVRPSPAASSGWLDRKSATEGWKELLSIDPDRAAVAAIQPDVPPPSLPREITAVGQVFGRFVLCKWAEGLLLLDQHRAHKRVLYEKLLGVIDGGKVASQQLLFPEAVELSAGDAALVAGMTGELQQLGFDLSALGPRSYQVAGIPAEAAGQSAGNLLEELLEQYQNGMASLKFSPRERLLWSLARTMAIPYQRKLTPSEQTELAVQWVSCSSPHYAESGQRTFLNFSLEEIQALFS
jgi:DNA mismatch repair protein MutL